MPVMPLQIESCFNGIYSLEHHPLLHKYAQKDETEVTGDKPMQILF